MEAPQKQPDQQDLIRKRQDSAASWFRELRDTICSVFEEIENEQAAGPHAGQAAGRFQRTPWDRGNGGEKNETGSVLSGGGEMAIMRGRVFEKVGVNISTVHGTFSENFRKEIPGGEESGGTFRASGISLVAHMRSPHVPAVHMNTRMIVTSKCWFGGGADLNPMFEVEKDTQDFHTAFKECCDRHDPAYYKKFKEWCDEYFFIRHRGVSRGVGGIFYDYLDTDWEKNFAFTQDVGRTFTDIYPQLVRRHMNEEWTAEQREQQLIKRGHYAEYNLLYDRGTRFGLMTGGNTDAILMSLPPEAKWP